MPNIVEIHRFGSVCPGHSFECLIEHFGDRGGSPQAVVVEGDWAGLNPGKGADQRAQGRHWTTCLAAGDGYDRLLLFGARALIGNHAYGPVAVGHRFGRAADDREIQSVQLDAVMVALLDVLNECERAPPVRRARGQVAGRTPAEKITAARLEVFASDCPGHSHSSRGYSHAHL